jgi:C1A family cysteine protease
MVYLEKIGQELTSEYPYTARDGSCHASASKGKVEVKSIANVTPRSPSQLMAAIAKGPTSVTVEADRTVFQMYTGGVLNSTACGTQLDHAITAVGYGN